MIKNFDVIVVGSGPGGYKVSKLLIQKGLKVCLIEKDLFGGVCLNRGCIPKDFLYSIASGYKIIENFFKKEKPSITWEEAVNKSQERINLLRKAAKEFLERNGLVIIEGEAKLVDKKTVKVNNYYLRGKYIVLACGSKQKENGVSPEDILSGKIKPGQRVLIKGEGPTACEIAFLLNFFGFKVILSIKERLLSSIPQIPEEFSDKLESFFEELGVEITYGSSEYADTVINATGRKPNLSPHLFPEIKVKSNGFVEVDDFLETNIPGIYAVGDLVPPMGAGYAFEKARVVYHNIVYGKSKKFNPARVPVIISSAYEVGFVGDYKNIVKYDYKALTINPKNFIRMDRGTIKVGYDSSGKPIFLCVLGFGVSEIVNTFAAQLGYSFSHPSYAEILDEIT